MHRGQDNEGLPTRFVVWYELSQPLTRETGRLINRAIRLINSCGFVMYPDGSPLSTTVHGISMIRDIY